MADALPAVDGDTAAVTDAQARSGPLRHASLIVADVQPLIAAYTALGLVVRARSVVSAAQAMAWGHIALAACPVVELAPHAAGATLLRLIEVAGAAPRHTRHSHGWLALEILVRDVDALAARLPKAGSAGFELVGPPADLDVSPAVRAMQLVGPAGEMLYLTQVKAAVPPFQIPLSSALPPAQALGPLFIAVLSTPSREAVVSACAALQPGAALRFETRITVLNRALAQPLTQRWPVATLQWAGCSLFEIDEVQHPQVSAAAPAGQLPQGLAWIGMDVPGGLGALGGGRLIEISPGAWLEPLVPPAPDQDQ